MLKKFVILLLVVGTGLLFWKFNKKEQSVTNFNECVLAGNPVMESYPRGCRGGGRLFVEEIGNELDKVDLIQIESPRPNSKISSPVTIKGKARGYWFFEASFPVKLYDDNNKIIGSAVATADGEWMTEDFVPFTVSFEFSANGAKKGKLILEKDNPSGLAVNEDFLEIPVSFN